MTTLITGGNGFIGQHVQDIFLDRCERFAILDHAQMPGQSGKAQRGDVTDYDAVASAMRGCDAVIHLAGVLGTSELFDDPQRAIKVNVGGSANVIRAAAELGVQYVGITMPHVWDNIYQATKGCAEAICAAYARHRGLRYSHVRAFNAYGVGQHVHGVQKIIPTFATKAWRGEPIPIWGDGTQFVDLVWAGDVAEMLVRAREFGDGQVFDAGTGVKLSVNAVAQRVIDACGSTSKISYFPMRDGEHKIEDLVAHGEGWDLMGWRPPSGRVDELIDTIDWYKADRP